MPSGRSHMPAVLQRHVPAPSMSMPWETRVFLWKGEGKLQESICKPPG